MIESLSLCVGQVTDVRLCLTQPHKNNTHVGIFFITLPIYSMI